MLFIPSGIEDRRCGARPNETNGLQLLLFLFFQRRRRRRRVSFLLPFSFEEMIKELSGEEKKLNEIIMWNLIFFFLFNLKYSTRNLFIMMLNVERILLKFWEAKRGERGSRGGFPRMYGYVSRFLVDVSCGLVRSFFDRASYFSRGTYAMPLNFRPT